MTPQLAGLSLKQRQDAIRAARAADDPAPAPARRSGDPFDDAAASPRLMEGYNSRAVDEVTWAKIAFHLAAGVPIIKIAEHYKLSRTTIWRALSQSPNLRRRVAEERALMRREADSRFVAMRELVVDTLYRAVADGNMRATIWAAERLGIGDTLLQQAERPSRPGQARRPQGWWPTDAKAAALLADIETPPETPPDPAPVPAPQPPGGASAPAPSEAPGRPPAPPTGPVKPARRISRALRLPIPNPSHHPRGPGIPRHPRMSIRVLAWLLHNSLPIADGDAGAPGLTAARLVARARWLALTDPHKVH